MMERESRVLEVGLKGSGKGWGWQNRNVLEGIYSIRVLVYVLVIMSSIVAISAYGIQFMRPARHS